MTTFEELAEAIEILRAKALCADNLREWADPIAECEYRQAMAHLRIASWAATKAHLLQTKATADKSTK